ncbi:TetR/AcrR family transcriptional regulator [Nonomuraea sp. NPDC050790]|uniref:TetR/AcrR family transcriptional regulator n=1 Tax=Nonomuraea sp. NPDC050790 TaxID=3364371 RepID=UPI00378C8E21
MKSDLDRKTVLADAAIDAIGEDGLRGLTHRAVELRAGLPPGTCSYHFPTRHALLAAVLSRIAGLEQDEIERFGAGMLSPDMRLDTLVDAATATLAYWLGPARTRSRARLLLELDPPSRELTASTVDTVTAGFVELATIVTGDEERARLVVALIDGLVLDELIHGAVPVDVERLRPKVAAVAALALPPAGG